MPQGLPPDGGDSHTAARQLREFGAGQRRNPWLAATLFTRLRGAASRAREGLQLLDLCFNEMGLLAPVGDRRGEDATLREDANEYLVRNPDTGLEGLFFGAALVEAGGASEAEQAASLARYSSDESSQPGFKGWPKGTRCRLRSTGITPSAGWPTDAPKEGLCTVESEWRAYLCVFLFFFFFMFSYSPHCLCTLCSPIIHFLTSSQGMKLGLGGHCLRA